MARKKFCDNISFYMTYVIAGLGNPGEKYERSRHNAGRRAALFFAEKNGFPEWKEDKKLKILKADGKIGSEKTSVVLPDDFMNNSGKSLKPLIKTAKAAERLAIIHDDLDLPLGKMKISFGRSSGGHKGVESVIKNLRTKDFIRIRIGISPESAKGAARKPKGQEMVQKFILGNFSPDDEIVLKKVLKKVSEALESIIAESRETAMNKFNS